MQSKKCLTYNADKTQDIARNCVSLFCVYILTGSNASINMLQKLCGSMCYSSLFLIADYELENDKIYTFENVCYHVPGLLKSSLHELLENLSDICVTDACITECLKKVLHDCMFAETVDLLKHNVKETYCAFFYMYCHLTGDEVKKQAVVNMWQDNKSSILKISTYFEREVFNNGKGLF